MRNQNIVVRQDFVSLGACRHLVGPPVSTNSVAKLTDFRQGLARSDPGERCWLQLAIQDLGPLGATKR